MKTQDLIDMPSNVAGREVAYSAPVSLPERRKRKAREQEPQLNRSSLFKFHPDDLPEVYALRCTGDCMVPLVGDGQLVEVNKSMPCNPGDLVVLYVTPKDRHPLEFEVILKRLVMAPMPGTTFPHVVKPGAELAPLIGVEMLKPPRQLFYRCSNILAMHRCVGPMAEDRATYSHHLAGKQRLAFDKPSPAKAGDLISLKDLPASPKQIAAYDWGEPLKLDDCHVPTTVEWAKFANPFCVSARLAYMTLTKTKPELVEALDGMDDETSSEMIRWLKDGEDWFGAMKSLFTAALTRLYIASEVIEQRQRRRK